MSKLEMLLSDVGARVDKFESDQAASGERFNIFSIAKIERSEVDTHSAMLAELFSPCGSHGQGDKFLVLFLNIIMPGIEFSGTQHAKVFKERSFNGGRDRVDILIELHDYVFLVENKIDALDGKRQLKRYSEVAESFKKKWCLIYLTKYGSVAEESSSCGVEYQRISYCEDIFAWLDACVIELASLPAMKYALRQYQCVVQKITGTSMRSEMRKEIVSTLMRGDNLKHASIILEAIPYARQEMLFGFFERVEKAVNDLGFLSVTNDNLKEFIFDKSKCMSWFLSGSKKARHVGVFFDIGISDFLFRIEVAREALHYGIVPVAGVDFDTVSIEGLQCEISNEFERRSWEKIKWFSVLYKNDVAADLGCLGDEKPFVDKVIEVIKALKISEKVFV